MTDLRLFVEIAEQGSFSRAAQRLGIPQPTASRRIRKLEDQLGLRLLERSTRHVRLTEIGVTFVEHCLRVLQEVDETLSFAQNQHGEPTGELTVSSNVVFSDLLCEHVIPQFIERYPKVRLLYEEIPGQDIHKPYTGDILVSAYPPQTSNYNALPLVKVQRSFYASPSYLERHGVPAHPKELHHHRGILLQSGFDPPSCWRWQEQGQEHQVQVPTQVCLTNMVAARMLTIQGLGVSWLPVLLCQSMVEKGLLIHLFDGRYVCDYQLYAIYQARRNPPPKIRVFLEHLANQLRALHRAGINP